MDGKFILAAAGASLLFAPAAAYPASLGFNLNLQVPVYCMVTHQPVNFGAPAGSDGISLGQFSEFCNSPNGYRLIVSYTPGTLQGTRITAGDEEIVLNGSGRALLSEATGPRIRERSITAAPGEGGFNTDRIELQIEMN